MARYILRVVRSGRIISKLNFFGVVFMQCCNMRIYVFSGDLRMLIKRACNYDLLYGCFSLYTAGWYFSLKAIQTGNIWVTNIRWFVK